MGISNIENNNDDGDDRGTPWWYNVEPIRWNSNRLTQPQEKPYCYAAAVSSVLRYMTDTMITVEDIVKYIYGTRDTMLLPDYERYQRFLHALAHTGITYRQSSTRALRGMMVGVRKINFPTNGVNDPEIHQFLVEKCWNSRLLPVICTISVLGGALHDVVIIGIRVTQVDGQFRVDEIQWWNPVDNRNAEETFAAFVEKRGPLQLVSLFPYPEWSVVRRDLTFRLTVNHSQTFNPLFLAGIAGGQITVRIDGWLKRIRTTFVGREKDDVFLRTATDLYATHDRVENGGGNTPAQIWICFEAPVRYEVEVIALAYAD